MKPVVSHNGHRLSPAEVDFIELFGLQFDGMGMPRMAGRVFGFLLICDPPAQTPAGIRGALRASISSVSTMLGILTQLAIVDVAALPGERAKRYRIAAGGWERLMLARLQGITRVREILGSGRRLVTNSSPDAGARIEAMDSFYAFMGKELARMARTWTDRRKKRDGT